ncbi:hypothetical protein AGLY_004240 [Aphis glycines]|uniref:Uncharacterized protein n=1 Tax=Aphis glycines TaxID=307491 RepID=A0A6G0TXN4_APHGL|nr:hypothetical protein AGLY_004240 [Aphis glycines]
MLYVIIISCEFLCTYHTTVIKTNELIRNRRETPPHITISYCRAASEVQCETSINGHLSTVDGFQYVSSKRLVYWVYFTTQWLKNIHVLDEKVTLDGKNEIFDIQLVYSNIKKSSQLKFMIFTDELRQQLNFKSYYSYNFFLLCLSWYSQQGFAAEFDSKKGTAKKNFGNRCFI